MLGDGAALGPWSFAITAGAAIGVALAVVAVRPRWVVRFPGLVLALLFAVCTMAGASLLRLDPFGLVLEIDPSTEPLLPAGDPLQALYRGSVLDFGDDEVYVVVVECDEVFSESCLRSIEEISDPIARMHGVRSVSSLLDVTSFRYVAEDDWIEVRPFIDEIPSDRSLLAELRRRAVEDPVYRRTIVSEDARSAAINVVFREMTDAELIDEDFDGRIQRIVEEAASDGLRSYVSGRPHFKTHVYHGMLHDLRLLIPLALLGVVVVLWISNGTFRGVLLPIATALVGNLWAFGAMAYLGRPVTLLTVLLAPTLLALGSVYGVHVMSRYHEEALGASDARVAALRCLEHLVVPVTVAGLTTVVGFGALLITDVPAVFELGALSMLGVASITLFSLTGIPAVLALLPVRTTRAGAVGATARIALAPRVDRQLARMLDLLAAVVRRLSLPIILVSVLLALVAAFAIPRIVIDTDYLSYFDPEDPVRVDFEQVNRLMAGAIPLYVVLDGTGAGSFREPDVLRGIETLQRRIDALPGVSRTISFVDSLRMLNRAFHADDPAEERIPETRPAVSELLFMLPKSDAQRFTTVNHARANVIVRSGLVGSAEIRDLSRAIEEVIAETPLPRGVTANVTGNAILLARSADGIARGQPRSVALAAITIFLLIALGLGSPKLGLVAMVPNLLPVLIFFGALGLGAAPLSLPTSLIGCVALGIAIDDTVHFLVRYLGERRTGAQPEEAARRCSIHVGRPVAITSVMLILGFLVIAFSEFATLREFGVLSALTMAICLGTDLILLPAILVRAKV